MLQTPARPLRAASRGDAPQHPRAGMTIIAPFDDEEEEEEEAFAPPQLPTSLSEAGEAPMEVSRRLSPWVFVAVGGALLFGTSLVVIGSVTVIAAILLAL